MSGSFSDLWPTWIGGTAGGTAGGAGGGWQAAPGMAEAGYGLAPGITQLHSDPASSGAAGGNALASALKSLSGAASSGQSDQQQAPRAQAPQVQSQAGRPSHAVDIGALLNQLNQWRSAYMSPSAINPLSATSATPQRQIGLLGM
jgi:hypothetical protein